MKDSPWNDYDNIVNFFIDKVELQEYLYDRDRLKDSVKKTKNSYYSSKIAIIAINIYIYFFF